MKTPAATLCLLLAAGAGFSLGWVPGRNPARPGLPAPAGPAAGNPSMPPAPAGDSSMELAALLPELTSAAACQAYLKELDLHLKGRHTLLHDTARDFALRCWLELDAESALAAAEAGADSGSGAGGIGGELFRIWLDLNPESAIAAWNQTSPALARLSVGSFLSTLAQSDAPRAFGILVSPRGSAAQRRFDPTAHQVLRLWAQQDPLAALAAVKTVDTGNKGAARGVNLPRDAIWEGWAASDPAGLLAYARSGTDPGCTLRSTAGWLVPALLKSDPKAVQAALEACGDITYGVTSSWTQKDPLAALAWAETQPADSRLAMDLKLHAAGKLATADPLRAIALLGEYRPAGGGMDQGFWLKSGYREAFASLAATDPAKAREMIEADPALAAGGALNGYMTHAINADPAAAMAQAKAWLQVPELEKAVVPAILMAYNLPHGAAPRDFSPVLEAMPELASQVDAETLKGWAIAAPESAAEFLASREAAGQPMEAIMDAGVLSRIASSRPEWTAGWLASLPEGALRQETAEMLAANWSTFDPEAAEAWIGSLPPGPSRDAALRAWDKRLEVRDNPFMTE